MPRFVVIKSNCDKHPEMTINIGDKPSHLAVEEYQRQIAAKGHPTGVTWQVVEGDAIDALIALARLP